MDGDICFPLKRRMRGYLNSHRGRENAPLIHRDPPRPCSRPPGSQPRLPGLAQCLPKAVPGSSGTGWFLRPPRIRERAPRRSPLRRSPPDILQLAMIDSSAHTPANAAAQASGTPTATAAGSAPVAPTAASAAAAATPADASAAAIQTEESVTPDQVRMALRRVKDPELNLNIIDLGLVYDIRVDGSAVTIDMSLTSPGCPSGPEIMGDAERQVRAVPGVTAATMNLVWTPFWSPDRIEPRVRAYLGM
jgi:metal-sulfur cluster biosynthetic enzyme